MNIQRYHIYTFFMLLLLTTTVFGQERIPQMRVTSHSFNDGDMMDLKYTCDGNDISPQLSWSVPEGTRSFALSCIDPDAPMGDFIHWLVYNIPAGVSEIPEGGPLPESAVEVRNDFGRKHYGGPCPPSGIHRYFFTVYALDTDKLNIDNKDEFLQEVEKHSISKSWIMGRYTRNR